MRTKFERTCASALALGLFAGCASDLWYKKGAGTEALAQDKAACRAETASLAGAQAGEAFEKCMSARDWLHVATAGRRNAAAPAKRKVARTRPPAPAPAAAPTAAALAPAATAPATPPAETPPVEASPAIDVATAPPGAPVASAPLAVDPAVAEPTPQSDAMQTPPVDTGSVETEPEGEELGEEETEEFEEASLAPEPVDPKSRQFWIKLGAGPGQLQTDQKVCRRELGLADAETQPSRWGQSEAFDACMRSRGWGGGSVSAVPNR